MGRPAAVLLLLAGLAVPAARGEPGSEVVRLKDGVPVEATMPSGQRAWTASVDVPPEAVALSVAVFGDRDVDLYLRRDRPVSADPAETADVAAMSPAAREVVSLSPLGDVRLVPGTWFLTVVDAAPKADGVTFHLVAFVDRREDVRTLVPSRPLLLSVPGEGRGATLRTFVPLSVEEAVLDLEPPDAEEVAFTLEGPGGYRREGSARERIVISRSEAPAGHYTLALRLADGDGSRGRTLRTTWRFADGATLPATPDPILEPGASLIFRMGGADGDVRRFRIPVREGSGGFVVEATNPDGLDVDLYLSRGSPPAEGILDAEWIAFSTGFTERLVVGGVEPLAGGTYHGEVVLGSDPRRTEVTLTVRLRDVGEPPFTWGAADPPLLAADAWHAGQIRIRDSAVDWHSVDLPRGATSVHAQVLDAGAPLELVFARRTDGGIGARAATPLVNERLEFVFRAPLPAPTRVYLGVVNHDGWEDALVPYRVAVGIDRAPPLPRGYAWPPGLLVEQPTLVERIAAATVEITIDDASGGSGVLVSPRGLVLTCLHTLQPGTGEPIQRADVVVGLNAKVDEPAVQAWYARVWAEYADQDLVMLEIVRDVFGRPRPSDLALPWVPLGEFESVRLGQSLWVAGFPQEGSERVRTPVIVTRGIVAGLERRLGRPAWVKTDAWIAPGHSGGPMLDEQGRLVAVSAATLGSTESLGLGVPVALLPAEWRARITEDLR
jgi:hypothetical protein